MQPHVVKTFSRRIKLMRVVVTGASGFIGRNLVQHLSEMPTVQIISVTADDRFEDYKAALAEADMVFHLAGVNRPKQLDEFARGNRLLTEQICQYLTKVYQVNGRSPALIVTSSIQAELDNEYGRSKKAAENAAFAYQHASGANVFVFRLPNVFGKWCKPNYNSVVATFCHNIANNLPISIHNPEAEMALLYVDDLVERFVHLLEGAQAQPDLEGFEQVMPVYKITVGGLASYIQKFKDSRDSMVVGSVGVGLERALHATYLSHLQPEEFSYLVARHEDDRGAFVEMLKTERSGQFSYFTAHPGITRGGHYHHTKTEKFLVIQGVARFKFKQVQTGEFYELTTSGGEGRVVETVPGWTHDVTNVGNEELIVMLWANEIFDRDAPDTYARAIQ